MFMIPGWLISVLTFPGAMLHEFAHKIFCDIQHVPTSKVVYFQFGNPAGYVLHEKPTTFQQTFWISVGPLLINSIAAIVVAIIASAFPLPDGIALCLSWLAISFGAHSFPTNSDVQSILEKSKERLREGGSSLHLLSYPFIFLIRMANALRVLWFDFFSIEPATSTAVSTSEIQSAN
jgi:Putative zincin peptidase